MKRFMLRTIILIGIVGLTSWCTAFAINIRGELRAKGEWAATREVQRLVADYYAVHNVVPDGIPQVLTWSLENGYINGVSPYLSKVSYVKINQTTCAFMSLKWGTYSFVAFTNCAENTRRDIYTRGKDRIHDSGWEKLIR